MNNHNIIWLTCLIILLETWRCSKNLLFKSGKKRTYVGTLTLKCTYWSPNEKEFLVLIPVKHHHQETILITKHVNAFRLSQPPKNYKTKVNIRKKLVYKISIIFWLKQKVKLIQRQKPQSSLNHWRMGRPWFLGYHPPPKKWKKKANINKYTRT